MRSLKFLPFAFMAGAHGFAIFTPYVLVFMVISQVLDARRCPVVIAR